MRIKLLSILLLSFVISNFSVAQVTLTVHGTTESRCVASGTIDVSTVGGFGPYNYQFKPFGAPDIAYDPVQTLPGRGDLLGLSAGWWTVRVKDSPLSGAASVDTMSVYVAGDYQDPILTNFFEKDLEPTCGGCNGELTAKVRFGRKPYKFTLRSGTLSGPILQVDKNINDSLHTFTDLCIGTYTIQIEDSCGNLKAQMGFNIGAGSALQLGYNSSSSSTGIWVPYPGSCNMGAIFVNDVHPQPAYNGVPGASQFATSSSSPLALDTAALYSSTPRVLEGGVGPYIYNLRKVDIAGAGYNSGSGATARGGSYYPNLANAPYFTFDVTTRMVVHTIAMRLNSNGNRNYRFYLENSAGTILDSADHKGDFAGIQNVFLGFDIAPGSDYKLRIVTLTSPTIYNHGTHIYDYPFALPSSPLPGITITSIGYNNGTTSTARTYVLDMAIYDPTVVSLVESRTDRPLFRDIPRNFEYVVEGIDACGQHYDLFLRPDLNQNTIGTPFASRSGNQCGAGIGPDNIGYRYPALGLVNDSYYHTTKLTPRKGLSESFRGTPPYKLEIIAGPGILPGPIYRHYGGGFLSGDFATHYPSFIPDPTASYTVQLTDACGLVATEVLPPVAAPSFHTSLTINYSRQNHSCSYYKSILLNGNGSEVTSLTVNPYTPGAINYSSSFTTSWNKGGQWLYLGEGSYEIISVGECSGNVVKDTIHVGPPAVDSSFAQPLQPCGSGAIGKIVVGYFRNGSAVVVPDDHFYAYAYAGKYDTNFNYPYYNRISAVELGNKGVDTIKQLPAGTYTIVFTSSNISSNPSKCLGYFEVTLLPYTQPEVDIIIADQICAPDTVGDIFPMGKYGVTPYQYSYRFIGESSDSFDARTQDTIRFADLPDSSYEFRIVDACGNSTLGKVNTGIPGLPFIEAPSDLCEGSTLDVKTDTIIGGIYTWYLNGTLLPHTGASFSVPNATVANDSGLYKVVVTYAGCPKDSSEANVRIISSTAAAIASVSKPKYCEDQNAILTGSSSTGESIASGYWTYVSGPTILPPFPSTNPLLPAPIFTLDNPYSMDVTSTEAGANGGTENPYVMRFNYTTSDGCIANNDVSFKVVRVPQSSFPGPNQVLCNSDTVEFLAQQPSFWSGYWEHMSGPGTVTFDDSSAFNTKARGLTPGADNYVFRWNVYNDTFGMCTSFSEIVVADRLPTLPADAGKDSLICRSRTSNNQYSFTMYAEEILPGRGVGSWSVITRPLQYQIPNSSNSGDNNATFTFYGPGYYQLVWSVVNGACDPEKDTVELLFAVPVASGNQNFCLGDTSLVQIKADSVPTFVGTWSMASSTPNPGPLLFSPNTAPGSDTANVSNFDTDSATYELLWTIDNGMGCVLTDSITLKITLDPTTATILSNDTVIGCANNLKLRAIAPTVGEGSWRRISGSNTAVVLQFDSAVTNIYLSDTGTYEFEWRVRNLPCFTGADTVTVRVTALPPTLQLASITNPPCFGDSSGVVVFSSLVVTPPRVAYEYSMTSDTSGFGPDSIFTDLKPGIYTGWIRPVADPQCVNQIVGAIRVLQNPELIYESVLVDAPFSCEGNTDDGTITVRASGGVNPITYTMSGDMSMSNTTGEFSGLSAGTYSVMAEDANGCMLEMFADFNLKESKCDTLYRQLNPSDSVTVCVEPDLYGGPYQVDDNAHSTNLSFINLSNVFYNPSTRQVIKTGAAGWNGGIATTTSLTGDAIVQFRTENATKRYMAGLSYVDAGSGYTGIAYAIYIRTNEVRIYESGTYVGTFGSNTTGDIFTVRRDGDSIRYFRNSIQLRSVLESNIGAPMLFDASLHDVVSKFTILNISRGYTQTPITTYKDSTLKQEDTCVTFYSPAEFNYFDSTRLVICDTVFESVICDTTWLVFLPVPKKDTLYVGILGNGDPVDTCVDLSELPGTSYTYMDCGLPSHGILQNINGTCFRYLTANPTLDEACVIICDDLGFCDTTYIIYYPPVTPDTIFTTDSVVCIDTTEMPAGYDTILTCDGMSMSSSGNAVSFDANGCVTISPTSGVYPDTTCVIICDSVFGLCDTTFIVTVLPPTPDTIVTLLPSGGGPVTVCADTSELYSDDGITYTSCKGASAGVFNNIGGNCYSYIPVARAVDTTCVIACDKYGLCDTTLFVFIPPLTVDTIFTLDSVTCVDTTEMPLSFDTIMSCDGTSATSNGGSFVIDQSTGCVTVRPDFSMSNLDTTCIVVCDTVNNICDTTYIINYQPLTPDTSIYQMPQGGGSVMACSDTSELPGSTYTYSSCGGPTYGVLNRTAGNCYSYLMITNKVDTACVVTCDEFGVCDTSYFIFIPPLTNDTIFTNNPVTCVDTNEMPLGHDTIRSCDGSTSTSNGGSFIIDQATGCVTVTPDFSMSNLDTTCIVVCDTVNDICDTTYIINYAPLSPDTIITLLPQDGSSVTVCADTSEVPGSSYTYLTCGGPNAGILNRGSENCYTYIPVATAVDTACVVVCDEFGVCDTTYFIFIPPLTNDTIFTNKPVSCVDTNEMPLGHDTIRSCDGSTSTSNGGSFIIDQATGCVTITPDFSMSNLDTTCIVVCDTVNKICDTTYIINYAPLSPDTVITLLPQSGGSVTVCADTSEVPGSSYTYLTCGGPSSGVFNRGAENCYTYIPVTTAVDTACVIVCDEFGVCDTTYFIFIPPLTNDTIFTNKPVSCVDTNEMPLGHDTIRSCDGSTLTSNGGSFIIDQATGCVTVTPDFSMSNLDTTCIVVCDTVNNICDTTYIINYAPLSPDTIITLLPQGGGSVTVCADTTEVPGSSFSYTSCGGPSSGVLNRGSENCYTYIPINSAVDTACVIVCDEFGVCDTTYFIFIPPLTNDTVLTTNPVTCVDTTELPLGHDTIQSCDGTSATRNGGSFTIDQATGCVTVTPDFSMSNADTTCIIVCDTVNNFCDTTIIITIKPPVPDTIILHTNGGPVDSCVSTNELIGSTFTYKSCRGATFGVSSRTDSCYNYIPIVHKMDTTCVIVCDEFGICDTTVFIYVPPVTPATVITTDTVVCVDTTEMPAGHDTIRTCDGMNMTSNGGTVSINQATGCVTTTPNFTNSNSDTTCIVVCDTVLNVCDTTWIITLKPPTPDTLVLVTNGKPTDVCINTDDMVGSTYSYHSCGVPVNGTLSRTDTCYNYIPINNVLDTACVVICDEYNICDTTLIIYIPPVTPDTVVTTDTVVCVDTTEIPGGFDTIKTCDGMDMTSNGGSVVIDQATGCVTSTPDFSSQNTDTTCVIVCNTIHGIMICDTTIIITVAPPTPDTITILTGGNPADTCISSEELAGSSFTYHSCAGPSYGSISNVDSCYRYVPTANKLDTTCVVICDEFGICDTTVIIYIPPVTPDTVVTTNPVTCVDTTENPLGVGSITTCDGMNMTSSGGNVSIDQATGCVTSTPDFSLQNTDTTCVIVCNTAHGMTICDTTIIITVAPPTPDTIAILTGGNPADTCLSTSELAGSSFTYSSCGNPIHGSLTSIDDTCFTYTPINNTLDTACIVICDEFGICDTTLIIYIPPMTTDTVYTLDSVVCVDTTEISGGYQSIATCDGMNMTGKGGSVSTDVSTACVTTRPVFGSGLTDTTCIIICNTIQGIPFCDTTIIINKKPSTPDTIYACIQRDGEAIDSMMNTDDLLGAVISTSTIHLPNHGQFTLTDDTNAYYQTSPFPRLDTVTVVLRDKFGCSDMFTFIYIPPMYNDTIRRNGGGTVCVDASEMPANRYSTIGTCDGSGMTYHGGTMTPTSGGCVDISPNYGATGVDTTCIILCDTVLPMCECDTTIIITFKPTIPDTFAILLPKGTNTADTCLSTAELFGSTYTYRRLGAPAPHGPVTTHNDTCINYVQTSTTKYLDTARVLICDEYGNCDTTIIIYVPTPDPDTLMVGPVVPVTNVDTCVAIESSYMTGQHIGTCDATGTTSLGVPLMITGNCVRYPVPAPVFTGDTACIIVCDTIRNITICDTTLIVYLPDVTPPTVVCKNDTVYLSNLGTAMIDTSNVLDTMWDNTLINAVWLSNTMFNCSDVGQNSVTVYARDTNRNMDSCIAVITVLDRIPPTAVCQNVTIQLDSNGNASIVPLDLDGGSYDNCGIASMSISQTSYDCSHIGMNTVTLTVTDIWGNVSTCTAVVTVEDNISPITYCPGNKETVVRNTTCAYIVEDFTGEASAWDNCLGDDITFTQAPAAGDEVILENSSTTITITATDATGNSSSCSFEVYARCVRDLNIPQFISPDGNGQNDTWEIPELQFYSENTVKVFNRWGNLVFEQKGYYTGWDGSSNVDGGANRLLDNKMLPEGTYFYIIDLGEKGSEPYVGYMQIKR